MRLIIAHVNRAYYLIFTNHGFASFLIQVSTGFPVCAVFQIMIMPQFEIPKNRTANKLA